MTDLEQGLRALVAELVRDEVKRALAEATKPDELLTVAEAAAFAKVAPDTVRRWIRADKIDACNAGRELRIRRADLDAFTKGSRRSRQPDGDASSPEALAKRLFG